jgi:cobalt-zinc-cadmium resistance protein CzcA
LNLSSLARVSAERPALTLGIASILVVTALFVARGLDFDALPDVTPHQVVVLTGAPGQSPEEVERRVTRPVEIAIAGVAGLSTTRSVSRAGISSVSAIFAEHVDILVARQLVAERLSTLDLGDDVMAPELGPLSGGLGEIFQFTLSSPVRTPSELLEVALLTVVPILRNVRGVVEVNTWGGGVRTIEVTALPLRLAAHGLSFSEFLAHLSSTTGLRAGGSIDEGATSALLRGRGAARTVDEIADTPLFLLEPGTGAHTGEHAERVRTLGTPVRIGDLALVRDGVHPRTGAATLNGRGEVVYVMAQMLRDENALAVMRSIHAVLDDARHALPEDVVLDIVYDRSKLVTATLMTAAKNLLEGGVLVVIVLLLLLGSVRAGLAVALVIPLSLAFAAALMATFGLPGTLMSLGALDFGLLVDGAVVMVESVFHDVAERRKRGEAIAKRDLRALVARVMSTMARPVFFSVLIITIVYVPILSLEGVDGKMFRPMALTVIFALLASLVLALTVVPALASSLLTASMVPVQRPRAVRAIDALYAPMLAFSLKRPVVVLVSALAMLVTGGILLSRAGSSFVPVLDEGDLVIQTTRRADIALDDSIRESLRLERALTEHVPEVTLVASRIGSPAVATDVMGLEQADVFVGLKPRQEWRNGLTRDGLVREIEHVIGERAPGGELAFTQPVQMRFNEMVGGEVSDVALSFYGEDLSVLREVAERALNVIIKDKSAADARIIAPPDVSTLDVIPRPLEALQAGMTTTDVLSVVEALQLGVQVGTVWQGPRRVDVMAKLAHPGDAHVLGQTLVPTSRGLLPLSHLADLTRQASPSLVSHNDGQRRIVVGFNVRGDALGDVAARIERALVDEVSLPRGVRMQVGGQVAVLNAAKARLALVIPVVMAAIVLLLTLAFASLARALIVFLHVPFASVGGIIALSVRDLPISISAAVGFIALSGIAVLNGVVLMGEIARREGDGESSRDAARGAALVRSRPVLMTALVAALGFVPMMLATGMGAEVQRPLATVVVGGLLTSTVLTLLVLPSLYPWLARGERRPRPKDA